MKITKYGHACLLIQLADQKLLVDPGSFTTLPDNLPSIDLVIVTEEHYDHFNLDNLQKIKQQNPDCPMVSTVAVASSPEAKPLNINPVEEAAELAFARAATKMTFKIMETSALIVESSLSQTQMQLEKLR